jgi:hypothetical protein
MNVCEYNYLSRFNRTSLLYMRLTYVNPAQQH